MSSPFLFQPQTPFFIVVHLISTSSSRISFLSFFYLQNSKVLLIHLLLLNTNSVYLSSFRILSLFVTPSLILRFCIADLVFISGIYNPVFASSSLSCKPGCRVVAYISRVSRNIVIVSSSVVLFLL